MFNVQLPEEGHNPQQRRRRRNPQPIQPIKPIEPT